MAGGSASPFSSPLPFPPRTHCTHELLGKHENCGGDDILSLGGRRVRISPPSLSPPPFLPEVIAHTSFWENNMKTAAVIDSILSLGGWRVRISFPFSFPSFPSSQNSLHTRASRQSMKTAAVIDILSLGGRRVRVSFPSFLLSLVPPFPPSLPPSFLPRTHCTHIQSFWENENCGGDRYTLTGWSAGPQNSLHIHRAFSGKLSRKLRR